IKAALLLASGFFPLNPRTELEEIRFKSALELKKFAEVFSIATNKRPFIFSYVSAIVPPDFVYVYLEF
ncbi:MAG: hypothetical protein IKC13_04785, partial [Elusimicrobiaceae bacterium]|nr:hypothetical protein [Elusimicrobiaceae bacterium]